MACAATIARSCLTRHVLRMIKSHIEALFEALGETFQRRIGTLYIRMANQAHRDCRRDKLGQVATGACLVAREAWRCRVVRAAFMASRAGERGMTLAGMDEPGVIKCRALCNVHYRGTENTHEAQCQSPASSTQPRNTSNARNAIPD